MSAKPAKKGGFAGAAEAQRALFEHVEMAEPGKSQCGSEGGGEERAPERGAAHGLREILRYSGEAEQEGGGRADERAQAGEQAEPGIEPVHQPGEEHGHEGEAGIVAVPFCAGAQAQACGEEETIGFQDADDFLMRAGIGGRASYRARFPAPGAIARSRRAESAALAPSKQRCRRTTRDSAMVVT